MTRYRYSALLEDGSLAHGHIEAASEALVIQRLEAVRQHAIKISAENHRERGFLPRGLAQEVTTFTRQLGWLLRAGMTLNRALEFLSAGREGALARKLGEARAAVRAGESFAQALQRHPDAFPPDYVSMIRMAEASGTLTAVLERIADVRERRHRLKQKVLSSLLYPAILVVIAVGALGLIFTAVIPKLHVLFAGQDDKLPASARALLAVSDWLTANAGALAVVIAVAIAALVMAWRRTNLPERVHAVLPRLPLIGKLRATLFGAEFCRTLAMLIGAGVGLPAALDLIRAGAAFQPGRRILAAMAGALHRGEDYLKPMEDSPLFPALVPKMLRVGAETGSLVPALEQLTAMLEREFETRIERLLTLLEPAIIVALSAIVGFIVITVMNGVISINDLAGGT